MTEEKKFEFGPGVRKGPKEPVRCCQKCGARGNVRPAPNSQGIECWLCPDCLERFMAYMRGYEWRKLSEEGAHKQSCLMKVRLYGDDVLLWLKEKGRGLVKK